MAQGTLDSVGCLRVTTEGGKTTFDATVAITPAASATDIFVINGSASATIKVHRVELAATTTGTTTVANKVSLIVRSAVDTSGTSTAVTGIARDANSVFDATTSVPTAAATVLWYSVNPTTGSTSNGGTIRNEFLNWAVAGQSDAIIWDFGTHPGEQELTLRGAAASLAVNANGASFPAGTSILANISWTEEATTA